MLTADLAIYGSHNGGVALAINGKIDLVIEMERLLNHKNVGMFFYFSANSSEYILEWIASYIYKHYKITHFNSVTYDYCSFEQIQYFFPATSYRGPESSDNPVGHHSEHAWGSLYQSPHEEALTFSFDGGGRDGVFNVYFVSRSNGITLKESIPNDLGFAYMSFGDIISEIRHEPLWYGNLVYSGKLMGLSAYGSARKSWLPHFVDYYKASPEGPTYKAHLSRLMDSIKLDYEEGKRFEGHTSEDIAATSQRAFEEVFLEYALPHLEAHPKLPVHMVGGCALNILLNTRLVKKYKRDVFVSPNPSDCGMAVGMLCNTLRPNHMVDITYAGLPVLDEDMLYSHVEHHGGKTLDIVELAHDLNAGKIIGVVRGRAEHGPRALGNRSILCNPAIPGMKDILNTKVKHRESYRPFAPVVRLEDVKKYFAWDKESRWMSFCPKVKKEWRESLGAIVHADNTARVQTVTAQQNPWLYRLLTELENITGVGVLLNTSFNTRGKPILSSYHSALEVYREEELDCLVLEDFYIAKHKYCPPDFL